MELNTKIFNNCITNKNYTQSSTAIENQKMIHLGSYLNQDKNKDYLYNTDIYKNRQSGDEFINDKNSLNFKHAKTMGNKYQIIVNGKFNLTKQIHLLEY